MVKVLELPIYDSPNSVIRPAKAVSPTNIEIVLRDGPRTYVLDPIAERVGQMMAHLRSAPGIAQTLSIGGALVLGRQIARRVLPMAKSKEYTLPFKAAHYAIYGTLPVGVVCAWFDTPRQYAVATGRLIGQWSLSAAYWAAYSLWYVTTFTLSALWTILRGIVWDIPYFFVSTAGSTVVTAGSILLSVGKSLTNFTQTESTTDDEPIITVISQSNEPTQIALNDADDESVNPSEVEKELVELKRHDAEESIVTLSQSNAPTPNALQIDEDPGQSEDEDKELFPSRPR